MTTSFDLDLKTGSVLEGKWNKARYRVERLLGSGANGTVFLVKRGNLMHALKIGFDAADHQSEVNALKALSQSSTSFRGYLVDVDDYSSNDSAYPFYVMRYIKGQTMSDYMFRHGRDWIYVIGLNMLRKLSELHGQGYIFGDIKLQNMLVSGYGDVELIDFGGVTLKGRAVKQFTEVYDRGYWGAGSRSADEAYDLFSFAMLVISSMETERTMTGIDKLLPQNRSVDLPLSMLRKNPSLAPVAPLLRKALHGGYASSGQMLAEWRRLSLRKPSLASPSAGRASWLRLCFVMSLLIFSLTVYLYWS